MSEFVTNFHFIRPVCLLLVPVAIGLWWIWQRQVEPLRGWREQVDPALLKAMAVGHGTGRDYAVRWVLVGWIITAVAIAGPTWRLEPNPFADDAAPLMILLKAGPSMEIADPAPAPLERAHLKIVDLAKVREGQELGLVAYSGSAHLVLPPTGDTEVVAEMAREISPAIMPAAGDRLDLALQEAHRVLTGEYAGGTLLVIADSIEADESSLAAAFKEAGSPVVQFLSLAAPDSPEEVALKDAARVLDAEVRPLTLDDEDVKTIARSAERSSSTSGISGTSSRWQEAGYGLVPVIAMLVALSFRRQVPAGEEESS